MFRSRIDETAKATTHRIEPLLTSTREAVTPLLGTTREAATLVRDRTVDLLDSDAAHEMRRRAIDVVAAARGDGAAMGGKVRRWPVAILGIGVGIIGGLVMSTKAKRTAETFDGFGAVNGAGNGSSETSGTVGASGERSFPRTDEGVIDLTSSAVEDGLVGGPGAPTKGKTAPSEGLGVDTSVGATGTPLTGTTPAAGSSSTAARSTGTSRSTGANAKTGSSSTASSTRSTSTGTSNGTTTSTGRTAPSGAGSTSGRSATE